MIAYRLVLICGGILIVLAVVIFNLTSATSPVFFSEDRAYLSGPKAGPSVYTNATGIAKLETYSDIRQGIEENNISLDVENIDKVISAHVHMDIVSENGPVVFTLFNTSKPTGEINGNLVWINITSSKSIKLEGPMSGKNVLDLFQGGPYYVDVHTEDYPEGEIRGNIEPSIIS